MDATFEIGERVEITPRSLTGQAMAPVPAVIVAGPTRGPSRAGAPPTYHAAGGSGGAMTGPLGPRAASMPAMWAPEWPGLLPRLPRPAQASADPRQFGGRA